MESQLQIGSDNHLKCIWAISHFRRFHFYKKWILSSSLKITHLAIPGLQLNLTILGWNWVSTVPLDQAWVLQIATLPSPTTIYLFFYFIYLTPILMCHALFLLVWNTLHSPTSWPAVTYSSSLRVFMGSFLWLPPTLIRMTWNTTWQPSIQGPVMPSHLSSVVLCFTPSWHKARKIAIFCSLPRLPDHKRVTVLYTIYTSA